MTLQFNVPVERILVVELPDSIESGLLEVLVTADALAARSVSAS